MEHPAEKRRSDRIEQTVPVEVIGNDPVGFMVFKQGSASVINKHGASIEIDHKFLPDQVLTLRNLANSKESEARVVGLAGQSGSKFSYGIALLDSDGTFWGVQFPDLADGENPLIRTVLSCKTCNHREVAHLDEVESRVLANSGALHRQCTGCRTMTVWSPSAGADPDLAQAPAPENVPAKTPQPTPVKDTGLGKRRFKRVATTFPACVRQFGPPGEVVFCENISRGGLCFHSQSRYPTGTQIEVAVPYSAKGQGNIFVPGKVVHVSKSGKMFRHGVEYL